MKIRVVKTASGANAVQVIQYRNNTRVVLQHIGSAHSATELNELKTLAEEWIKSHSLQLSIFPDENPDNVFHLSYTTFLGVRYNFFYNQMLSLQRLIMFNDLPSLLTDLVIMRIFEPASKLRSLDLLQQFFGIIHSRKLYYKIAPECLNLKQKVEQKVIAFAKQFYSFNFNLVFYDVTTLYFETFEEDDLRKNGFSNKTHIPLQRRTHKTTHTNMLYGSCNIQTY